MRLPLEEQLRPLQKLALLAFKALFGRAPGPVLIASFNKPFLATAGPRA